MTPEQFSRSIRASAATHDWAEVDRVCRAQAWCELREMVALGFAAAAAQCRALSRRLTNRSDSGHIVGTRGD